MEAGPNHRTVIFAGGGTGGHLFPGIAVADELRRRDATTRVVFVGSEKPLEREILGRAGYEQIALSAMPPSAPGVDFLGSMYRNWIAYRAARKVVACERSSVVVGLGGFASVPPVVAAWRQHVPIVLLEQNVVPGKATRWLSRLADVVCLPWLEAGQALPQLTKTVVTGNPIRRVISTLASESRADAHTNPTPTLVILGGSQGAATLNALVLKAVSSLRSELANWRIVHQTGAGDVEMVRQTYAGLSITVEVTAFVADMSELYRRATCVVSRAGATTLAELACAGAPTILVPLPTSAHDHQRQNAKLFFDRGAAQLVEQSADSDQAVEQLAAAIRKLLDETSFREQSRHAMKSLAQPQAASAVADILQQWLTTPNS